MVGRTNEDGDFREVGGVNLADYEVDHREMKIREDLYADLADQSREQMGRYNRPGMSMADVFLTESELVLVIGALKARCLKSKDLARSLQKVLDNLVALQALEVS